MAWKRIYVANSYTGTLFHVRMITMETTVNPIPTFLNEPHQIKKARHLLPPLPLFKNEHILFTELSEESHLPWSLFPPCNVHAVRNYTTVSFL